MATIHNKSKKEKYLLHNQHTIGRGKNNISCIEALDISRRHAVIFWENNYWQLTDFSSNGTRVNNVHVHHATKKLEKDDLILFSNNKKDVWEIINLDPPNSYLRTVNSNYEIIDLGKGKVFPEESNPKWTLFRGKNQNWMMDDGEIETILIHGKKYQIEGVDYEFIENECLADTNKNIDFTKNACFHFFLSTDEENITSKIKTNDLIIDLGNRVYNHLLLHLVRAKQQDLEFGLNDQFCGWVYMKDVEQALSKELLKDIDAYYINILIHRLRKSLIDSPPYGYLFTDIIERKKGKLRFGLPYFSIEKEQLFKSTA
ncbi:MAG: FHA domain-containing protein [Crocinitomicaceae bacterium]|nr:FHA domain-containing protein [Flavobacteriales bacterium]NQZ37842.1 FHA domain-containing protein [Crocinitomicaceae bacterium]